MTSRGGAPSTMPGARAVSARAHNPMMLGLQMFPDPDYINPLFAVTVSLLLTVTFLYLRARDRRRS